jgi:hypothetical protein
VLDQVRSAVGASAPVVRCFDLLEGVSWGGRRSNALVLECGQRNLRELVQPETWREFCIMMLLLLMVMVMMMMKMVRRRRGAADGGDEDLNENQLTRDHIVNIKA